MANTVYTDNKQLVSQYANATALQPIDPVFLLPKGDPGVASHSNSSAVINNAAGTVRDHGTKVAHRESYLGAGQHPPGVVKAGQISGKVDGDTGFLSWAKSLYIEGRQSVQHAVDAGVNAAWSLLPAAVQNVVQNGNQVVGGLNASHFGNAAANEGQAMLEALKSTDTLIALAQTAALMGVSAIPVVGQLAGGAAVAMRMKSVIESSAGAAAEFKAMMERWTQPMSPAQLEIERQRLASFILRAGVAAILAALGKAMPKLSKGSKQTENSKGPEQVKTGEGPSNAGKTSCACAIGKPVIIATGEKQLLQTDFELPGRIPLLISRHYRSGQTHDGWFGQGWSCGWDVELRLRAGGISYRNETGRQVNWPWIEDGEAHFDAYEQLTLLRTGTDSWILRDKSGRDLQFERPREDWFALPLKRITDRNGNALDFEFSDLPEQPFVPWRPVSVQCSNRRLLFTWDGAGHLEHIALRVPQQADLHTLARYRYNGDHQLIGQLDALGQQRHFSWERQVLCGYIEPNGAEYRAEYDRPTPQGRVLRSWAVADGSGLRFEHLDRKKATRVTDELGRSTLYEYDERRDIVATTGPDGVRVVTPFDTNGHPRGSVDALGRETRFQFDQRGNLTAMVDAAGSETRIRYNETDQPVELTDAMGGRWGRTYDERGNLTASTDPLDQTTRYEMDQQGQVIAVQDARGGTKRLEWNDAGLLKRFTDCSQRSTEYGYDPLGRLVWQTDALQQQTQYEWDAIGRLVRVREPGGASHRYEWDANGSLLGYVDPQQRRTQWHYSPKGEVQWRKDAVGRVLQYGYDPAGRLTELRNENGESTRFAYDILDRLTDEVGFDGRHQRYVYNAAGELTHLVERGGSDLGPGKVTRYERDALGRLLSKRHLGVSEENPAHARYAYDKLGRLTGAHNAAAQLAFAYDPAGRLLSETQTLSGNNPRRLTHEYDALDNRIRTQLPDGRSLNWLFYGSGYLHQINLEQDGEHQVICDMERDDLYRETSRSQGALRSQYAYDPMGRLRSHRASAHQSPGAQVVVERAYQYDLAGNLLSRQDSLRGLTEFQYDPTGRILAARGRIEEFFAFDPAGNIQEPSASGPAPIAGNRLRVYQDLRFEYDEHGNVTQRKKGAHEEAHFEWGPDHQMAQATVTRHGVTQTTRYEYDAMGRRTRKNDAFGATEFLWDGDLMIEARRGKKQALFLFEPDSFVPLATVQDGCTYWYQCDQIGAPQELTDGEGKIAWAAHYRAWGEAAALTLTKTGTDGQRVFNWPAALNAVEAHVPNADSSLFLVDRAALPLSRATV